MYRYISILNPSGKCHSAIVQGKAIKKTTTLTFLRFHYFFLHEIDVLCLFRALPLNQCLFFSYFHKFYVQYENYFFFLSNSLLRAVVLFTRFTRTCQLEKWFIAVRHIAAHTEQSRRHAWQRGNENNSTFISSIYHV